MGERGYSVLMMPDVNNYDEKTEAYPRWFEPESESFRPKGVEKADFRVWRNYINSINQSEGFDIVDFPGSCKMAGYVPVDDVSENSPRRKTLVYLVNLALIEYNDGREEPYEFVDLAKANFTLAAGSIYYITFTAKNKNAGDDAPPEVFQARVFEGIGRNKVYFCRPKPKLAEN